TARFLRWSSLLLPSDLDTSADKDGAAVCLLPIVQTLNGSDVRLIWFDGDRDIACKDWMRKTGKSDAEFRAQLAAIDSRIGDIRLLFRNGWIDMVPSDGSRLPFPEILERLSIKPRFRRI